MIILKWYTLVLIIATLIRSLYVAGKNNEEVWIVICAVLLEMPIIVYLILS